MMICHSSFADHLAPFECDGIDSFHPDYDHCSNNNSNNDTGYHDNGGYEDIVIPDNTNNENISQADDSNEISNTNENFDFDKNGTVDALTDGALLLRYTFGLRGLMLVASSIAENSALTPEQVEANLEAAVLTSLITDIDGNGNVDALTDGLMLLRYLFDAREDALIGSAFSIDGTRTTSASIVQYIAQHLPSDNNGLDNIAPVTNQLYPKAALNFSASSSAVGFVFDGSNCVITALVDSNDNCQEASLTTDTQSIYVSNIVTSNNQKIVTLSYKSEDTSPSGIGFRLHFNSNALNINSVNVLLNSNDIVSGYESFDAENTDNNLSTDKKLSFGWWALMGAFTQSQTLDVATVTFDIVPGPWAIGENSGAGQVIYIPSPSDFSGLEGDVIFNLSGNDASSFAINSLTGEVTLVDNPDYEAQPEYNLSVMATDVANNTSEKTLNLKIENLDDTPPIISHDSQPVTGGPIEISIDLNSTDSLDPGFPTGYIYDYPNGYYFDEDPVYNDGSSQTFYTVDAADDISDIYNDNLTYSLTDDTDSALSINADTGAVSFVLDSQTFPQSSLAVNTPLPFHVMVTDSAGNSQIQAYSLTIVDTVSPGFSTNSCVPYDLEYGDYYGDYYDPFLYSELYQDGAHCIFVFYDASTISSISVHSNTSTVNYVGITETDIYYDLGGDGYDEPSLDFGFSRYSNGEWWGHMDIHTGWSNFNPYDPYDSFYPQDIDFNFTITATDNSGNSSSQDYDIFIPFRDITPNINFNCPSSINEVTASTPFDYNWISSDMITLCTITWSYDHDYDDFYYDPMMGMLHFSAYSYNGEMIDVYQIDDRTVELLVPKSDIDYESNSYLGFTLDFYGDYFYNTSYNEFWIEVINQDETAPTIVSSNTATAIEENTGNNQVIYTASANDTLDISNGMVFSIKDLDSPNASRVNIPDVDGSAAHIYVASSTKIGNQGESIALKYTSDNDWEQSFNLFFDSSKLDFNNNTYLGNYSDYTAYDNGLYTTNDSSDLDNDPATDSFISFSLSNQNTLVLNFDFSASDSDQSTLNIHSGSGILATHSISIPSEAGDNFSSPLSIDAATGEVTLNIDPDYETQAQYNFAIIATDMAGNISNEHIVTLPIIDVVTENPPVISSTRVIEPIEENSGSNQLIYTATAEYSSQGTSSLSFSLDEGSDSSLTIDATSGEVRLNTNPDYEQQSQYNFTIVATDGLGNSSDAVELSLAITNLDDTPPIIRHDLQPVTSDPVQITIDLNTVGNLSPGLPIEHIYPNMDNYGSVDEVAYNDGSYQVFYTIDAADNTNDIVSGELTYSLGESTDPALSIDSATGEISFVLNSSLDIESDLQVGSPLEFTVIVTDAAENSTSHQIELTLTDATAPVVSLECMNTMDEILHSFDFQMGLPQDCLFAAYDSSSISSIVFAVANDMFFDDGYDDNSDDDSASYQLFTTNNTDFMFETQPEVEGKWTGMITYHSAFLEEQNSDIYEAFTIISTDAAGNVSQSDYNLHIPYVDFSPTFSASCPEIDENSGSDQVVCELSWYVLVGEEYFPTPDIDFFSDGPLELIEDEVFDNEITTAKVVLNIDPDYEMQSEYLLEFSFMNMMGMPSNYFTQTLSINNIDEVAPQIISDDYANPIDENSGEQIVYIAAADDSADISDGVNFSLDENSDQGLNIDVTSGEVTLSVNPDYESQSEYNFTVIASDGYNQAEQAVTLAINNIDEVAPTITSGETASAIDENSGVGWVIYMAAADDSADISDGVNFSLDENSDQGLNIDATSGEVTLSVNPDYESKPEYIFTVIASDGFNQTEQAVTLAINNMDEVAPIITSGYTASAIDENIYDEVVYQVTAEDYMDISYSDEFHYELWDDQGVFAIDTSSGIVTMVYPADFEEQSDYSFTVIVTDVADNSSEQMVSLQINNLDEVAPVITSSNIANAVNENTGSGQIIYIATAEDTGDISDGFAFDLSQESDSELQIDPYTGEVVLTVNPDYELQSEYYFEVLATDYAGNREEQQVSLQILQEEAIDPVFQSISVADEPQGILGLTTKLEVIYEVSDENTQLPGIGFRVHYNSEILGHIETNNIFTVDLFVNAEGPFNDTEDFDNDPTTDMYLSFGWAALFGNWPNMATPLTLFELSFEVSNDIDVDVTSQTSINFTTTSVAEGYTFEPFNYEMNLLTATWDIDSNGNADALTDGLMMLRYAFGLRGESLTNGAVAGNSPLSHAEVEQQMVDTLIIADIDGNGQVDALTDGLLLLRYLFNLRGDSLTQGSVSAMGTRKSNSDITDYLERHMP
ncbi:cadherin repeat domain-containing protein [Porticoccaceae bacterium]|nr:cadherin repeat domain-containing protein [Porticoccaceae bacterium]MDA9014828.1 cadherin repeat domain-containing protein [Porticoccaceae bacterium]